jgi:DNA-binding LacI/PurR family transcriptional regulator
MTAPCSTAWSIFSIRWAMSALPISAAMRPRPPALHSETLAASCGNRKASFMRSARMGSQTNTVPTARRFEAETAASLTDRANRILDRNLSGPTAAVFCGCERTVVALIHGRARRGLSVPEELSIIGIGSSQLASWLSGGLSTVSWSLSEAGRLAADCVLAQVEGTDSPDLKAGIEAEFVARSSHGPHRAAEHGAAKPRHASHLSIVKHL